MQNLLETRLGRSVAFFFLYITEGIPFGFTATAVVTQMRRQGMSASATGAFVAALYLPWSFKWIAGPIVDVCYSTRFGKRRLWILVCQLLMVATLMMGLGVDFTTQVRLFTLIIFVHNIFGAVQDVAIDALACETLPVEERGMVNGFMFAGAYLGNGLGGSGVLFLLPYVGDFRLTFPFVGMAVLLVTVFVNFRLKERKPEHEAPDQSEPRWAKIQRELLHYILTAKQAFFGTRLGLLGLIFALLPCGAYSLGMVLQSNLSVDIGLADVEIAWLTLCSTLLSAAGCVLGGWLSDRYGRRRCIGLFLASTSLPVFLLAAYLFHKGWIAPSHFQNDLDAASKVQLKAVFWGMCLSYALLHGLMYGTRTAFFMDLCNPAIAATQFTAYMALLNVVNAYTAQWQGASIDHFGYPITLVLDGSLGLICLAVLVFIKPAEKDQATR